MQQLGLKCYIVSDTNSLSQTKIFKNSERNEETHMYVKWLK